MKKRKVILLLVDSLSNKDVSREKTPNIFDIIKDGTFLTLTDVFGFLAVGAAIYASLWPNNSKIFNKYVFGSPPTKISSPILRELFYSTNLIPNDRLAWVVRYKLAQIGKLNPWMASDRLPKQMVPYFKPKPSEPFTNPKCLAYPTLFDVLRDQKFSFHYMTQGIRSITSMSTRLIELINRRTIPDVMIGHYGKTDLIGHFYGPTSNQRHKIIQQVDRNINLILKTVEKSPEEIGLFIFSDHGMSPVFNTVDFRQIISKFNLRVGRDFLYFLDSTMARFWAFSKKSRTKILQVLDTLQFGNVLDYHERTRLNCDNLDFEHGNIIFVLNEGYSIHPDFFRRTKAPNGMHGYAFSRYSNPILVSNLKLSKKQRITHHVNLMPSILKFLGLPIPRSCQGYSLIEN